MAYVKVERKDNWATISLAREPVNSLNLEVWRQLKAAFDKLEADQSIRGVIFTSGLARDVFTAGNDLNELYAPRTSLERYSQFWIESNAFLAQVYCSPLATVSAIRGACPAGGCCLSLCCDIKIMTETGHIGLNEVALGIPVPLYWARLMARVIGQGPAERLCQGALLVSPQQALQVGLVDQVVTKEQLLPTAEAALQRMLKLPDVGRHLTKSSFRNEFAREWVAFSVTEPEGAWEMLNDPKVLKALEAVFKRLAGNKKSKM